MNLDTLIINIFCLIDDELKRLHRAAPWRRRGFAPRLSDAEVICIETVGELLGLDTDTGVFRYFRRHFADWFPALRQVHRTTFARQSANLWRVKDRLWQSLLPPTHSRQLARLDSFPAALCRFARAKRCRLFRGFAAYGKDHAAKATIYGFRLHARISETGFITHLAVAPANESDTALLPQLVENTSGYAVADRNYWSPPLFAMFKEQGLELIAPFRKKSTDPAPARSHFIARHRQLIETVFSQLTCRFSIKRIWARDEWHLANRVIRKVLAHTIGAWLNSGLGYAPLQLANLLAD